MKIQNKVIRQKAARVLSAWAELAPTEKFGGYSLEEYQGIVAKADEQRACLENLEVQYVKCMRLRDEADFAMNEACLEVVDGVKGSEGHGANSVLYKAMGYVLRDERRSGLTRKESEPLTAPETDVVFPTVTTRVE